MPRNGRGPTAARVRFRVRIVYNMSLQWHRVRIIVSSIRVQSRVSESEDAVSERDASRTKL